jgi:hypothetical protein
MSKLTPHTRIKPKAALKGLIQIGLAYQGEDGRYRLFENVTILKDDDGAIYAHRPKTN